MRLNPLTYGLTALRRTLYWGYEPAASAFNNLGLALGVSVAFAGGMFLLASLVARGRVSADLQ
jgi:hypothetical protein